jgi:hypothetical protein
MPFPQEIHFLILEHFADTERPENVQTLVALTRANKALFLFLAQRILYSHLSWTKPRHLLVSDSEPQLDRVRLCLQSLLSNPLLPKLIKALEIDGWNLERERWIHQTSGGLNLDASTTGELIVKVVQRLINLRSLRCVNSAFNGEWNFIISALPFLKTLSYHACRFFSQPSASQTTFPSLTYLDLYDVREVDSPDDKRSNIKFEDLPLYTPSLTKLYTDSRLAPAILTSLLDSLDFTKCQLTALHVMDRRPHRSKVHSQIGQRDPSYYTKQDASILIKFLDRCPQIVELTAWRFPMCEFPETALPLLSYFSSCPLSVGTVVPGRPIERVIIAGTCQVEEVLRTMEKVSRSTAPLKLIHFGVEMWEEVIFENMVSFFPQLEHVTIIFIKSGFTKVSFRSYVHGHPD